MTEFSHDRDYERVAVYGAIAINGSLRHTSFNPAGIAKSLCGSGIAQSVNVTQIWGIMSVCP
jgi:hypothetical protein